MKRIRKMRGSIERTVIQGSRRTSTYLKQQVKVFKQLVDVADHKMPGLLNGSQKTLGMDSLILQ